MNRTTRSWLGNAAAIAVLAVGASLMPLQAQAAATPTTAAATPTTTVRPAPTADQITGPTVMAAGDIACDPLDRTLNGGTGTSAGCRHRDVANVVKAANPDVWIPLGDIQNEDGTYDKFMAVYDKEFGSLKSITKPIPGNHEYLTPYGAGYYQYFGDVAAQANRGNYSYDVGPNWHVIAINSNICTDKVPCGPGSATAKWIAADMAKNSKKCVMAVWHHPVWSAGSMGNNWPMAGVWNQLNSYGVDIALHGHDHFYQRYRPMGEATINPDLKMAPPVVVPEGEGMRSFILGTGGQNNMQPWQISSPGITNALDVYRSNTNPGIFGATKFTLGDGAYAFEFMPAPGVDFSDSGTANCRSKRPPVDVPSTPANFKAERAGDGTAKLSWDNGPAPAAAPVTNTVRIAGSSRTCSTTGNTCTISGLTNGRSYDFTVTAGNAVADMVSSPLAFVPAVAPTTPGTPTATLNGTTANVTWTAPTSNGGLPINQYKVTSVKGGLTCSTTGASTCQVPGLTPGVAYNFTVTAHNEVGTSRTSAGSATVQAALPAPASPTPTPTPTPTATASPTPAPTPTATASPTPTSSATASATPTAAVVPVAAAPGRPGAPAVSSLARSGDGRATVTVAAPASDGGSAIASYRVVSSPANKSCLVTAPSTSCIVSGLVNGTSYTFTAFAKNGNGESAASAPSAPIVAGRAATRPNKVTSVAGDGGTMKVSWTAPDWDGGLPIRSYTATSTTGGLKCTATGAMSCVVSGAIKGKSYSFTVTATNDAGVSSASIGSPLVAATSSAPGTPGKPEAPKVVNVARAGDGRMAVTVTPPAYDGASPLTSYRVVSSPGGKSCTMNATSRSCVVTGLINGTSYNFSAYARNINGESIASTASAPVVAGRTSGRPNAVTAVPGPNGTMAVSWTAPDVNGGLPVTSYVVRSTSGGFTCITTDSLSCVVNGLTAGKSYSFTVTAVNEAGASPASIGSAFVAAISTGVAPSAEQAKPGAPLVSALARTGDGRMRVSVAAPVQSGGSAITSYRVVSAPANKSCIITAPETSCEIIGLTNGTAYTFTATATNATGESAQSLKSVAMVAGRAATRPNAVTAVAAAGGTATVTWKAPDWDGGLAIQRYTVTSTSGGHTCSTTNGTTMSCTVGGLTPGKSYSFTVTASNEAATSVASSGSAAVLAKE